MIRISIPATLLCLAMYMVPSYASDKVFDDHADAEADVRAALQQAAAQHKFVLLNFGANWCPGCMDIDHIMHSDASIETALRHFVVVHICTGSVFHANKSAAAVRQNYPAFKPIPQLMVLDENGRFLRTTDGDGLTDDKKHNHIATSLILAFLNGTDATTTTTGH